MGHNARVDLAALDELWARLRSTPSAPRSAARRATGTYFTPAPLALHVCREVLAPLGARKRLRVLDPAAGDGAFLAAAREVAPRAELIGIERDPALAAKARARTGAVIHEREALLDGPDLGAVDAVVGNPPYVRSIRLRRADPTLWRALRGRFAATSRGEWDLYAAFVEQTLAWLRPGGRAGLVVPSRWLTAAFAGPLRARLAAAGAVAAVYDFGAAQVFPDATTYASVVFLETDRPRDTVAVARLDGATWRGGAVPSAQLTAAPWVLAVGGDAARRDRLAARGPALGDVARIAKGVGTNADPVYVVDPDSDVEPAATRPCLRGRDVTAFGAIDERVRAIYPYDAAGKLIPLARLAKQWPRAAAHLRAHRRVLEDREDGRFAGPAFHAYGRPQNLAFHADPAPKVVVPDVARAGRALVDDRGALVLDSAYALRGDVDPWLLAVVLSSPIVAWWLRVSGVPLRGGYVRLKTAYLAPLPLPPPGRPRDRAAALAKARRIDEALDQLRVAYDLAPDEWC